MVTGEMVEELILSGADIIKVGIGPGEVARLSLQKSGLAHLLSSLFFPQGPCAPLARRLGLATPSLVQ